MKVCRDGPRTSTAENAYPLWRLAASRSTWRHANHARRDPGVALDPWWFFAIAGLPAARKQMRRGWAHAQRRRVVHVSPKCGCAIDRGRADDQHFGRAPSKERHGARSKLRAGARHAPQSIGTDRPTRPVPSAIARRKASSETSAPFQIMTLGASLRPQRSGYIW